MSESTSPPDSTRTLFELQRLSAEVEELNILLEDSDTIIRSLFQLLRDHNIPVGSTELIKAREKVEAEREALKLKVLELSADAARVRCSHKNKEKLYPDEIETLRTANAGLVEKVKELKAARTKAAANSLANMLSYEEVVERMKRLEEALEIGVGASHAKTLINNHVDNQKGQP